MEMQDNQAIQLKRIADVLEKFYKQQYPEDYQPEPPVTRVPLGEYARPVSSKPALKEMKMDIQQFAFRVSERDDDTVSREITLTIDESVALPEGLPRTQVRVVEGRAAGQTDGSLDPARNLELEGAFEVPEGTNFQISTVAVDNGGNRSEPTVQDLNATDEVNPLAEGVLERVPLDERSVDDPTT